SCRERRRTRKPWSLRMARLPYLDQSGLKPEHKDLLNRPINLFRGLVHSPDFARTWSGAGGYTRHKRRLARAPLAGGRGPTPPKEPARPAAARAGDPAGRLSRALALRIFPPRQDRP